MLPTDPESQEKIDRKQIRELNQVFAKILGEFQRHFRPHPSTSKETSSRAANERHLKNGNFSSLHENLSKRNIFENVDFFL